MVAKEDPILAETQNKTQMSKLYAIMLNGNIGQFLVYIYVPYFAIALGVSYSEQGLVTSIRAIGNSLTQSFWGSQADKHGRRPILILGYAILAITTLLYTLFIRINIFLILLAIQGFCGFAVLPTVTNSMLGDVAHERERGTFIGKITSVGTFGSVPVILLFGYLLDRQGLVGPSQYHLAFLSAAMFSFLAIFLIVLLKETLTTKPESALPSSWTIIQQHQKFRRFLVIDGLYMGIMAFIWPLFPFVMKEVVHATNAQISAIWAGWMLSMAIAQKYGGVLSDRIGRKPLLIFSRTMLFLLPLSAALTSHWPTWLLLLAAQCLTGFGSGLALLMEQMVALDLAPTDQKALFTGITFALTGVTGFLGALLCGTLAQLLAINLGQFNALFFMLWVATVGRLILGLAHFWIDETAPTKTRLRLSEV